MPTLRERGSGEEWEQPTWKTAMAVPRVRENERGKNHRRVAPEKRASALAHYLEGVGLRATERLVGVSHNAVMNWVREDVGGKALAAAKPEEVKWVEADELWRYVGKKNGLLVVVGY